MSNVYANRVLAGPLSQRGEFSHFDYAKTAGINETVALSMPVGSSPDGFTMNEPGVLHPIFAMNIPEGRLRETLLRMFAKALPFANDDATLLEIVGRSQIGRLRVAPSVAELDAVPALSLASLLATQSTGEMFESLLTRYARYSGIAGVQPKILVRDDNPAPAKAKKLAGDKIAVSGATHIVKFFDAEAFPALAANEYACLRAASAAGLPVPAVSMANDAQCLAVERFDKKPDGSYMGIEDACTLAGWQPKHKYIGSYEQVAKSLTAVITPAHLKEDMGIFFRTIVLSTVVRNGDAHRKNFSVLYDTPANVRFSPVYDIISTTPYIKNDTLALLLSGSKRWPSLKKLIQFGVNSCRLTPAEAADAINQVRDAVARTRKILRTLRQSASDEHSADALAAMLAAWEEGLAQTGRQPG